MSDGLGGWSFTPSEFSSSVTPWQLFVSTMPGNFFEFSWHSRSNGTADALAKVRPGNKYPAILEAETVSVMPIRFLKEEERHEEAKKSIWLPKSKKITSVYTAMRTVTLDDRHLKRTKQFECEFYFVDNFVEEFGFAAIIIGTAAIHNNFVTHNNPRGRYYVLEE